MAEERSVNVSCGEGLTDIDIGLFQPTQKHLALFLKHGTECLIEGKFSEACFWLQQARETSMRLYGESSLQCACPLYKHGVALLCKHPIQDNPDPMANTLKIGAYFSNFDEDTSTSAVQGASANNLEAAFGELKLSWAIMEKQPKRYSMQKISILSALGDVEFRRGDPKAEDYYIEALHILESLDVQHQRELADLTAKTYVCMRQRNAQEAAHYRHRAAKYYEMLLDQESARGAASGQYSIQATLMLDQLGNQPAN